MLKKLLRGLAVGAVAAVLLTVIFRALPGLLERIEYLTYYFRCQLAFGSPTEEQKEALRNEESDVCIIDIDGRSFEQLGAYWNWDRGYHARVLRNLSRSSPAAVGFDIMFDNPADRGYIKRFDAVLERANTDGTLSEGLRRQILSSVDYDTRFIDATRAAGVVYHAIRMDTTEDYAEHALSQVAYRMTPEFHELMNPSSALRLPVSLGPKVIRRKPILGGCFPQLARASRHLGHVNVEPSEDGVVREIPLLYRFDSTEAVYLPMSVRICADLFGTPNEDIVLKPGHYLDIGKPFKMWRDDMNRLRCSYPNMRVEQVAAILQHRDEILACKGQQILDVMVRATLDRDADGHALLELAADTIPETVLSELLKLDFGAVLRTADGDEVEVGEVATLTKESEGMYTLSSADGTLECYFADAHLHTLAALATERATLDSVRGRQLMYYPFSVRHQGGELRSTLPVLRGPVLRDLLHIRWEQIAALKHGQRLECGPAVRIPLTPDNTHIITYFGPGSETFRKYSYSDIYENRVQGGLSGKIFIVGSSAPGMFDLIHAPLNRQYPAVEVHASLIRSFLSNTFVTRLPSWSDQVLALLAGMLIGTVAFAFGPLLGALAAVVGCIVYGFVAISVFSESRLWIEMARPILTVMLSYAAVMSYRYMTEEKDRKFLQSTFKTYLSPEIIDTMYRQKQFPKLGGEERVCSAYFTDIQSFSTFSEKLGSPTRLVELLNEYLTELTNILIANGGTLDKYEGDAILAFFGAPMPMADHARQAVLTALAMQRKLGDLRDKWASEGDKWPEIVHNMRMRIGVNTGPIVTGNMGSTMRMNYTMMGDAVNLAARLESGAKQYGVYTMISDATYVEVKELVEVRQVDKLQVVGKSEPVVVYELLCEKGGLDDTTGKLVAEYNAALELFYRREWESAIAILRECEPREPFRDVAPMGMSPSRGLLLRCEGYLKDPPPADWDGVNRLTSK